MIEGKTSTGFEYELDEDALDDYELLDMLCEVDKGNETLVVDVMKKLLGNDQEKHLREHVRNEKGRVLTSRMMEELGNIMASVKEGKNLSASSE